MKHHYVPQFYLRRWASHRLVTGYYWAMEAEKVIAKKKGAKAFCSEIDLYALESVSEKDRHDVETGFFGHIDNKAGALIDEIATSDLRGLDDTQRCDWVRFINSLELRRPKLVKRLKDTETETFLKSLDEDEDILAAMAEEGEEGSPSEFLKRTRPHIVQDRLFLAIQSVIDSPTIGKAYLDMAWMRINLSSGGIDLITSDNPFVRINGLGDPNCICFLPLDAGNIFFCSRNAQTLRQISAADPREIVRRLNRDSANQAEKYIFDLAGRNLPLIEKFLRPGS